MTHNKFESKDVKPNDVNQKVAEIVKKGSWKDIKSSLTELSKILSAPKLKDAKDFRVEENVNCSYVGDAYD